MPAAADFSDGPGIRWGGHQDPRLPLPCAEGTGVNPQATAESADAKSCKHFDLHAKIITPDVLVLPHMASLEMTFYPDSGTFPQSYDGDGFAAEHGSWNRCHGHDATSSHGIWITSYPARLSRF
jgi:glucose/arabinose dehydrogenase